MFLPALRFLSILVSLTLASCSTPPPQETPPTVVVGTPGYRNEEGYIRALQDEYASLRVAPARVPDFKWHSFTKLRGKKTILKEGGVTLEIRLGERFQIEGTGRNRTKSRYNLFQGGKKVVEAESLLGLEGIGMESDQNGSVRASRDAASGTLVIEEYCYVFNRRLILLQPGAAGWSVKYFTLPERPKAIPIGFSSECEGFADGKIYFKVDDVTYAIPIEQLEAEASLEFGIG